MSNPFHIDGPTCLSFSMGRSSGDMLRRVLAANPVEVLREHLVVLTCNTGKEDEASLRFGDRIDREWLRPLGLGITWLEYTSEATKFKVVTFEALSRNGEPFDAIIAQRAQFTGPLPNPRSRYCSSEMKTRTMKRYLQSIGWGEWDTFIGIRADEQRRLAKFRANPHPDGSHETVRVPLADCGVTAQDVGEFWRTQSFDLELPNINGKTPGGNCDLCFLKPSAQIASLVAEKPERAVWWARKEEDAESRLPPLMEPIYEMDELSAEEYAAALAAHFESVVDALAAGFVDELDMPDAPRKTTRRQKIGLDGKPMFRQRPNTGALFRIDRPSYSEMARFAFAQRDAFDPDEEAIACFCGD